MAFPGNSPGNLFLYAGSFLRLWEIRSYRIVPVAIIWRKKRRKNIESVVSRSESKPLELRWKRNWKGVQIPVCCYVKGSLRARNAVCLPLEGSSRVAACFEFWFYFAAPGNVQKSPEKQFLNIFKKHNLSFPVQKNKVLSNRPKLVSGI